MSFKELVASMLNACKQQLATNGAGMTLLWCAIRRKGFSQELGVGRLPSIGNSHFPWRPDAPSNGRVGRMFQRMRGGAVSKGPARCTHTGTSMISSHQAVRKTDTGTSDMYPIRAAFQSLGNLEPRALSTGTACIKQCKRPVSRKLGGDRSKPCDFRSQGSNDGKATGTGSLEHLIPRCVAMRAMSTKTAYDEPGKSMQDLLFALQSGDAWTANLKETDATGKTSAGKWQIDRKGLLCYEHAVYMPKDLAVQQEIIRMNHDDPYAGHFGATRTTALIRRKYFWPGLSKDVRHYIKNCDVCQRTKIPRYRLYGLLQPLPMLTHPWKDISMDIIVSLPPSADSKGNTYNAILVVVDHFTKMVKYFPIRETIAALQLAELFCNEIVKQYSTPRSIVTDRRSIFTSEYWFTLCYYMKAKRKLSTVFHL